MNISNKIIEYLDNNNWNKLYEDENLLHYSKMENYSIYHLYIQYLSNCNEYDVELGIGDTQDGSQTFKLRNIISVLKRRGL